mmetsp:Transcript_12183/g.15450  ORF Transcript_12183/g.15450 Transcript_12183/m.15450 type:complete len:318 (+) Transcript_12183:139-1092(+)|eukprot:CAMPEP_0203648992 /NCGR_PEP_ID=MMETSP0088-20131115/20564_1 /ASSEMBLY_ACC=CAM_ASM_001087 /TAXON_ID=426623 /ORGANISM="Chaetoceros affinis, Strain CCMP159" /LENGTH=317 /DNA_ID=CAMNT_0050507219 /DNA_START=98 /DNA_END=1051 /DNA_ORIENTATION=-
MSSATGEATINPDGTTTTTTTSTESDANANANTNEGGGEQPPFSEEIPNSNSNDETMTNGNGRTGTDPAIYLALSFITFVILYMLHYKRQKKKQMEVGAFFTDMDGDKFNIQLPAAVDEYYEVKDKCIKAGWEPGKPAANAKEAANGPVRILAQALMKRCIADIPLVTHIQKESPGMNKLYSQSMCSIKQWKSYQAAEALISQEVEDVRAEADEIEPGWSGAIWRQAMQYHNMLKNRNEMEMKQREEAAKEAARKKLEEENRKTPEQIQKEKEEAAEKAAQELIQMEEREKKKNSTGSKDKAFKGGMKKGFLESKKK